MPAIYATAPAKIILFGEHAVVYNRPAIAAPVFQLKAKTVVTPDFYAPDGTVRIESAGIGLKANLASLPPAHPLAVTIAKTFAQLNIKNPPAMLISISSNIPVASGLGSGAAVSVATIRAISSFLGRRLPDEQVSALAFEIEQLYHGTPSGIDNSVITFARPVYYRRDHPIETLSVPSPFTIVIGDTGVKSPTSQAVGDVRRKWQANRVEYERYFTSIGDLVEEARLAIETGDLTPLGKLMTANHTLLQKIDVSSPELDRLVNAALDAGAAGAKLCGGGRGGNMIALVTPDQSAHIASAHIASAQIVSALIAAGAVRTVTTEVRKVTDRDS